MEMEYLLSVLSVTMSMIAVALIAMCQALRKTAVSGAVVGLAVVVVSDQSAAVEDG